MSERTEIRIKATFMVMAALGLTFNLMTCNWGGAIGCLTGMYLAASS